MNLCTISNNLQCIQLIFVDVIRILRYGYFQLTNPFSNCNLIEIVDWLIVVIYHKFYLSIGELPFMTVVFYLKTAILFTEAAL